MADEATDTEIQGHPLAARVQRAIKAHPILRDQKKLKLEVKDGRAQLTGTVFTRDMFRQLIETLNLIEGAGDIGFDVEPEIQPVDASKRLEGKVPPVSDGPLPSLREFSVKHLPRRG